MNLKIPARWLQYVAVLGTNLGIVSTGMHFGWASNALPLLTSGTYTFTLSNTEASWLASMTFIGEGIGSLLTLALAKLSGRKRLILLASPILFISWLLLALGQSKAHFYIGRLLGGMTDGLVFSVVPPYLNEIADEGIRGFMGAVNMSSFALGIAVINWLALWVSLEGVSYIAAVGALSMLLIVPFLPESPHYLLWANDEAEAARSLQKLRGKVDVEEEVKRMAGNIANEGNGNRIMDILLKKSLRQCLLVLLVLNFTANLSGAGAIQAYSKTLLNTFEEGNHMSADTANALYFAVFCISSITSPLFVDRLGRKRLLVLSASLTMIPLIGNGVFLLLNSLGIATDNVNYLELVFILLFTATHSMALYTLPVGVVADIFPSDLKTVAMCILNVCFGITNTIVVLLFNWTYYSIGGYVPFLVFASCLAIGLMFIILMVPDSEKVTK